ncbi:acyl-CoA dehydrogenase [Acinetobacter baumannii]|nr:acyl-CoA dehydrogenase [Acinetobacter baumannii]
MAKQWVVHGLKAGKSQLINSKRTYIEIVTEKFALKAKNTTPQGAYMQTGWMLG